MLGKPTTLTVIVRMQQATNRTPGYQPSPGNEWQMQQKFTRNDRYLWRSRLHLVQRARVAGHLQLTIAPFAKGAGVAQPGYTPQRFHRPFVTLQPCQPDVAAYKVGKQVMTRQRRELLTAIHIAAGKHWPH
jgi:hypothetical protein